MKELTYFSFLVYISPENNVFLWDIDIEHWIEMAKEV